MLLLAVGFLFPSAWLSSPVSFLHSHSSIAFDCAMAAEARSTSLWVASMKSSVSDMMARTAATRSACKRTRSFHNAHNVAVHGVRKTAMHTCTSVASAYLSDGAFTYCVAFDCRRARCAFSC